ncbi:hypothetical protein H8356DRAFT_1431147 [Neocallimastix lanati (nom. inval.)]|nr:hypothetical protein H8356DRAFT_1431147 [Neocallimastix sp. JGI-2020a]
MVNTRTATIMLGIALIDKIDNMISNSSRCVPMIHLEKTVWASSLSLKRVRLSLNSMPYRFGHRRGPLFKEEQLYTDPFTYQAFSATSNYFGLVTGIHLHHGKKTSWKDENRSYTNIGSTLCMLVPKKYEKGGTNYVDNISNQPNKI